MSPLAWRFSAIELVMVICFVVGVEHAGFVSFGIERTGARIEVGRATSAAAQAKYVDAPRATALGEHSVSVANIASGSATLSDTPMPQPAAPPVLVAAANLTDPVQNAPTESSEALDACSQLDVCIDQYLWSLYERTPKVDTVKVEERIKVKVKKKGKTQTVVKTLTKYITEDFGWKDPKAAQKTGMSLQDYVIGGMDLGFRRTLYNALRAMDDAGLSPGITSAFRDDYRQELASGDKAHTMGGAAAAATAMGLRPIS